MSGGIFDTVGLDMQLHTMFWTLEVIVKYWLINSSQSRRSQKSETPLMESQVKSLIYCSGHTSLYLL